MIESHLCEGRQNLTHDRPMRYGQSITDACLSLADTGPLLDRLARAQRARRRLATVPHPLTTPLPETQ
jgi:3-deoxy-7-phosphoheptulonate synthase